MNYTYDILLNFQDVYYDFFEWDEEDDVIHVKKIPIFLISHGSYVDIKNYKIKFNNDFVSTIYNKCEVFKHYKHKKFEGCFIVSDGEEALGVMVDKNGYLIAKSSLIFDEEDEINNIAYNIEETKLSYEILNNNKQTTFLTRFEEINNKKNLCKLDGLFKMNELEKIYYLYLECFDSPCSDKKEAYLSLKKEIEVCGKNYDKINEFFSILEQK